MKEWNFENGICVIETDYNYDLHAFDVYNGNVFLGTVYPGTVEDMNSCIKSLDNGEDPITESWEDGCGNNCSLEGWA